MQRTFWYDLAKPTVNKMMFSQRTRKGGGSSGDSQAEKVRDAEVGNLYITKKMWHDMGKPYVLKMVLHADDNEPDDPFPFD